MSRLDRLRRRWTWEPEVGDHLSAIWRARWFVLVGALVVAGVVLTWRSATPERYESTSRLRLVVLAEGDVSLDEDRLTLASRIYAEVADSRSVLTRAIELSETSLSLDEADAGIEVTRSSPPGFLDITASDGSPEVATDLANGMAEALAEAVSDDRLGPSAAQENGLTVVPEVLEAAEVPTQPTTPRPGREAGVAFLASLIVLAELSVLARSLSGRLPLTETAERVERSIGVPSVDLTGDPQDRTKLALLAARSLRDTPVVVVVQCGGWPNPAAALRLAEAMTGRGRRVLVVDGDADAPTLHLQLGVGRSPGVAEVLTGRSRLPESVHQPHDSSGVSVLTVGDTTGDGRWATADLTRLLGANTAARRFDTVVFSLTSASMPNGLGAGVEIGLDQGLVLVVDPKRTRRRQLGELVHAFGGPDEVDGLLFLPHETATVEIRRLARRWGAGESDLGLPPFLRRDRSPELP